MTIKTSKNHEHSIYILFHRACSCLHDRHTLFIRAYLNKEKVAWRRTLKDNQQNNAQPKNIQDECQAGCKVLELSYHRAARNWWEVARSIVGAHLETMEAWSGMSRYAIQDQPGTRIPPRLGAWKPKISSGWMSNDHQRRQFYFLLLIFVGIQVCVNHINCR